jgi:ribosomal protein S3
MEQSLIGKENKHIDKIEIELKDGTNKTVYFDITEFFIIDDK